MANSTDQTMPPNNWLDWPATRWQWQVEASSVFWTEWNRRQESAFKNRSAPGSRLSATISSVVAGDWQDLPGVDPAYYVPPWADLLVVRAYCGISLVAVGADESGFAEFRPKLGMGTYGEPANVLLVGTNLGGTGSELADGTTIVGNAVDYLKLMVIDVPVFMRDTEQTFSWQYRTVDPNVDGVRVINDGSNGRATGWRWAQRVAA